MNILNHYTVVIAFALGLAALAYFRPHTGRIAAGVFFLIMGVVVNIPVAVIDPTLFAAAGANALLPLYRWFFGEVLARYPLPFVILLILIEITIGCLILSKGFAVRLGLTGACLFCLMITPVGVEELTAPLLLIPFLLLLRHKFPHPVWAVQRIKLLTI